jgi:hypothetical protein
MLTLNHLNLLRFFAKNCCAKLLVRARCFGIVHIGQGYEFVGRLPLIECDDLVHAAGRAAARPWVDRARQLPRFF